MKITQIISIVLCLFLANYVYAQNNEDLTGSVLWEVSGNGLEQPSYIFGTHHLISSDFLGKIPLLQESFSKTAQVVGEVDMADVETRVMEMYQSMMMPSGMTYKELLSAEDYQYVDSLLRDVLQQGLEQMGTLKPAAISSAYVVAAYKQKFGKQDNTSNQPIDTYFQKRALGEGKNVVALETMEEQMDMFFNRSIENQLDDFLCMLRDPDEINKGLEHLEALYINGDLYAIHDLFNMQDEVCPMDVSFKDAILKNRNNRWLERLPEIMSDKSSFIAVGAAHLVGEEGLLWQLRSKGYTVRAVK